MLDVNLYTLNFVRSTSEPNKLFLIQESTGEPVYFSLRVPEGSETRNELYHASSLATLGVFQHISSKLKLISLANPSTTIELKNSGYINFEWTFYFDRILKFCWRKDIIGMAGSKRGYSCWMCRKPDPDYPCAIYRPGTSTVPPSCQFLDFNIRRIENLQDARGLEYAIILALLGFTEAVAEHEPRRSPPARLSSPEANLLVSAYDPPIQASELRVTENSVIFDLVAQGHQLLEDPLSLYLLLHAPTPNAFQQVTAVADQIKRDHLERYGEELHQYLVEDMMSQQVAAGRLVSSSAAVSQALLPSSLKIYLSRTPLDGLLPKSVTLSSSNTNKKFGKPCVASFHRSQAESRPSSFHGPFSSSSLPQNSLQSRFISGVHRPFSKIASIASLSSRSSPHYQHHITPYNLPEEEEQQEGDAEVKQANQEDVSKAQDQDGANEEEERSVDHLPKADGPKKIKKPDERPRPEPFMICVNELRPIAAQSKRNTLQMVKENDWSPENSLSTREQRRKSFDPSSVRRDERRQSSGHLSVSSNGDSSSRQTSITDRLSNSTNTSYGSRLERADSARSKSSSVRSSASSFVEIILSSCCQTYSAALSSSPSPPKNHVHSPLKRIARSRNSSAWKRLSACSAIFPSSKNRPSDSTTSTTPADSSDLISNLFSRKVHLS